MAHDILRDAGHRPWPLPRSPWVMYQRWEDLLFAHWPVEHALLRTLVPRTLEIDTFGGTGWVSQTPFRMTVLEPRLLPAPYGTGSFLEMNFRTYVRGGDRAGIYFFSLDASSPLAVAAARATYRLPYRNARMRATRDGEWMHYESHRKGPEAADFEGRYRAVGDAWSPEPGTIEYFLTERYALFAPFAGGFVLRGEIHHPRWTIRRAEAVIAVNTVPVAHGIEVPETSPALLHFAAPQDTLIWAPVPFRP